MLKTILLPAFAALALAAPAAAQQPLDLPAYSICGTQNPNADVMCVDFSRLTGIGGSVQLPERQMQIFAKAQPNADSIFMRYRVCDAKGTTLREGKGVELAEVVAGTPYVSYFQIKLAPGEFVCALRLTPQPAPLL